MPRFVGRGNNTLLNSGGTLDPAVLPKASTTTHGVVKIGAGISVADGVISIGSAGTVNSVALSVPSILSVAGSPITSAGTFEVTLAAQNSNLVFAGPISGATPAVPSFRNLVAADIPDLDTAKLTSGVLSSARIPVATASAVGGIKIGTGLSISNGVLNADVDLNNTTTTVAPNRVLAGPTSGGNAIPNFRALVGSDLPVATASTLGAIKIGTGLSISSGVLSADVDLNNTTTTVAANKILAGPTTGSNTTPTFRSLVGTDLPVATASTLGAVKVGSGLTISNGVLTPDSTFLSSINYLLFSVPSAVFDISGSPVTAQPGGASGTINISLKTQAANLVWASPNNTTGAPVFRSLVANDIPSLSADKIGSGQLAITRGGTGLGAAGTANQILGVRDPNADGLEYKTLVAGSGISISHAAGAITISNTAGGGTVTSIGMTVPTGLSVTPSSITTSGTFDITLASGYSIPTTASQTNWDTAYADRMKWDGGSAGLVAGTARASLGATTVGENLFTLTNPSAVSFLRINADNTVDALSAANFRTALGVSAAESAVTSVTAAAPLSSSGGTTPEISLGTVGTSKGGTGLTATPTNGQLLIGNGTGFSLATLTAGNNITITNTAGGIQIDAATGSGGGGGGMTNPMTLAGDIIYGASTGTPARLAGETGATRKFLRSVGSAGSATAPVWDTLVAGDIPSLNYLPLSGGTLSGSLNLGANDITNTGLINFKGIRSYTSSGGGAATSGYYAPVVITSITTQYARLNLTLAISTEGGSGDASEIETAVVQLRFKQQNSMGSSSIVDLEVLSSTSDSWTTDSFIFIQTSNTAGLSEGRLYVEIKHNYSNITATVLNYFTSAGASYTVCSASTSPTNALVAPASLPAGTQTKTGSFYTSGSDTLKMYAGSAERVRVSSAGRVGVGTTTPQTRLHVDLTGAVLDTDLYNSADAILVTQNGGTGVRLVSSTSDPTNIANVPAIVALTSRGSVDAATVVSTGDYLGRALFQGIASAGGRASSSELRAVVDAAPGSNFVPGRLEFWTSNTSGTLAERMRLDNSGNLVLGTSSLATTATNGFLYIAACAGTPTGMPSTYTGRAPMVFDSAANKFYIYNGGWQEIGGSSAGSGTPGAVTFTAYQMNLTSTSVAQRIDDVNNLSDRIYTVENIGYYGVYLGSDSSVSTSTGFRLEPGDIFETVLTSGGALWGVTEFGTVRLSVLRGA